MPCSPARAASIAAFRASRLVWLAISEITWMISPICVRAGADQLHGLDRLLHGLAALLGQLAGLLGDLVGLVGIVLDALRPSGLSSSIDAVICSTLELCVLRAGGQRLRALGDDPRALGELVGALGDLLDGPADRFDDQVHVVAKLAVGAGVLASRRLARSPCSASRVEHLADVAHRRGKALQGLVHALDDLAVLALELGCRWPGCPAGLRRRPRPASLASAIRPLIASMHWLRLFLISLKSPL